MAEVLIYTGSSGIQTKVAPVRRGTSKTGLRALETAVNILTDDTGRDSRCDGFSLLLSGNFHSLWCEGGQAFVVKYPSLFYINPTTWAATAIVTLTSNNPMAYTQTSIQDRVYWSNGIDAGYVENGINHTCTPETPDPEDYREFLLEPPRGMILEYANGRLYSVSDRAVWYSERFKPSLFWTKGFLVFPTNVKMIRAVHDGLWVSDERSLYWIAGFDPKQQSLAKKSDYPGIYRTHCYVDADRLPYPPLQGAGQAIKAWTREGAAVLGPGGFIVNETRDKLETDKSPFPFNATIGTGIVWEGNFYATFEP